MSKQESFKRRIRARMATTGERYMAARQALIDEAPAVDRRRVWVHEPEFGNDAIERNTGRSWDDWCDLIEAWPSHTEGHTAIAAHLREDLGIDGWWSQAITGGYERITGLRRPHQRADGTFTADKSKTITMDHDRLREMLLDDGDRDDLFGGRPTELRSKPESKSIRLSMDPGVALIALDPKADGRVKVTVSHERLPEFDDVASWKFFWADWLVALDEQ